jgi:succinate dehydrogenase/fumarate reductase flavoprotein subunit
VSRRLTTGRVALRWAITEGWINIIGTVDILIAGGGMAGCFAALGAAAGMQSKSLRILLVEPSNVLGRQATAGGA